MPQTKLPFSVQFPLVLLGILLLLALLYIGQDVFIPMVFAAFLAVLLNPVVLLLQGLRVPKVAAIFLVLAGAVLGITAVAVLVIFQIADFADELPRLEQRLNTALNELHRYVEQNLNVRRSRQLEIIREGINTVTANKGTMVAGVLMALTNTAMLLVLVPIYTFLFLYYRSLLKDFFYRLVSRNEKWRVREILAGTESVVQGYLVGLMIETLIVAILNTTALLLLGVDHAVLFGVLAALLNLIPYIGILIGGLLPALFALVSMDSAWYAVGVIGSFSVIQVVDNNIIVPLVVGGRVRINSIVAIAAVIAGGLLWGISGMFLSLPIAAIVKVIFDRVDTLQPWGMVLGSEIPGDERKKGGPPE